MKEQIKADCCTQELSKVASQLVDLQRRVAEIEAVIKGLEKAAESTARALEEVSSHWDSVYRAMRRAE